jgi:hypothetical protein
VLRSIDYVYASRLRAEPAFCAAALAFTQPDQPLE